MVKSADEEKAAFEARLVSGLAATDTETGDLNAFLGELDGHMSPLSRQVQMARVLRPSLCARLEHPWHWWRLRQSLRDIENGLLSDGDVPDEVAALGKYAAFVEFGVCVDSAWHRRLRWLVANDLVSLETLRSWLRSTTIWWGAAGHSPAKVSSGLTGVFDYLWLLGRRNVNDGELLISPSHLSTQLLVGIALLTSMVGTGFSLGLTILALAAELRSPWPQLLYVDVEGAAVTWAVWWIGPHSWSCAKRLQALLHQPILWHREER